MSLIHVAVDRSLNTTHRSIWTVDLATGAWEQVATPPPVATANSRYPLSPAPADGGGWWWAQAEQIPGGESYDPGYMLHVRDEAGQSRWSWTLLDAQSWPSAGIRTPGGWVQAFTHTRNNTAEPRPDADGVAVLRVALDGQVTLTRVDLPSPTRHTALMYAPYPTVAHRGGTIAVAATTWREMPGNAHEFGVVVWTFDADTLAHLGTAEVVPYSTTANPSAPSVHALADGTVLASWVDLTTNTVHLRHYTRDLAVTLGSTSAALGFAPGGDWTASLFEHNGDVMLVERWGTTARPVTVTPLQIGPPQADLPYWGTGVQFASVQRTPDGWTVANVMWGGGSHLIAVDPDGEWHTYNHPDWHEIIGVYPDPATYEGVLAVDTIDLPFWFIGTRDPNMAYELTIDTGTERLVEIVAGEESLATWELVVDDGTEWVECALFRPDA